MVANCCTVSVHWLAAAAVTNWFSAVCQKSTQTPSDLLTVPAMMLMLSVGLSYRSIAYREDTWSTDAEFGRMFLAGQNPVVIQVRVSSVDRTVFQSMLTMFSAGQHFSMCVSRLLSQHSSTW